MSENQALTKAQSSLATQLRTNHIGLSFYLHWRRVPGIDHPGCPSCGYPSQNAKHMVMSCLAWAEGRWKVLRKANRPTFQAVMQDKENIKTSHSLMPESPRYWGTFCPTTGVKHVDFFRDYG